VICYSHTEAVEVPINDLDAINALLIRWPVTWINVDGLGDAGVIARLGEILKLHRLALEDVLHVHQRAKVETYPESVYIVTREAEFQAEHLITDQISIFLGSRFVLTFQERHGDCLDPVRQRIHQSEKFRTHGPDYLAYAILDAVVDGYFPVLEQMGECLETLEEDIVGCASNHAAQRAHSLKRELMLMRRTVWPLRDAISLLMREPIEFVTDETRLHLRDCHDHVIQLIDMLETYRELGSDLMDIYLSSLSNRLNSVMKVLTIIATVFMPLSFIASVYGMNFDTSKPLNMPELSWRYGYIAAIALMALVAGVMVVVFWRQGWLGGGGKNRVIDTPPHAETPANGKRGRGEAPIGGSCTFSADLATPAPRPEREPNPEPK
jgi:magnesium transporter